MTARRGASILGLLEHPFTLYLATMTDACPFSARVAAELADPAVRLTPELAAHLPKCPACRAAAASAIRNWPTDRSPSGSLPEWLSAPSENPTLSEFQAEAIAAGRFADLELGPYLLLDRLGVGGMGEVFRGRHRFLRRIDAIKTVRPEIAANPNAVKRFLREAETAAKLRHPNVVQVYTADRAGAGYYIAMEFVAGTDLSKVIRAAGMLPVPTACDYIRQAAEGLHHAFEHGLVHRDVKPANLLLTSELVKVADFGLARAFVPDADASEVTAAGAILGTTDYMAPEQAEDARSADTRADIYSLGCSLFHLLAGQVPFPGGSLRDKLNRHATAGTQPLSAFRSDVPLAVEEIVRKCMAKRPEQRFQTPGELAEALRAVFVSTGVPASIGEQLPATVDLVPAIPPPAAVATRSDALDETHRYEPSTTRQVKPAHPQGRRWLWAVAAMFVLAAVAAVVVFTADKQAKQPPKSDVKVDTTVEPKHTKQVAIGAWKPVGEFKSPRTDKVCLVGFGKGEVIGLREGDTPDGTDMGWFEVWPIGGGNPIRTGRPKELKAYVQPVAISSRGDVVLFNDLTRFSTGTNFSPLPALEPDGLSIPEARAEAIDAATFNTGNVRRPADHYIAATAIAEYRKERRRFLVLWDAHTGKVRTAPEIKTNQDIKSVAVDAEGVHMAIWTQQGQVQVRDMNQFQRTWETGTEAGKCSSVAITSDAQTVYAGHIGEKAIYAWDVKDNKRGIRLECPWQPVPLVVSPDSRWLVAGGDGVRIWDLRSDPPKHLDLWAEWSGEYPTVAFDSESKRLAVGGRTNTGKKQFVGGVWVWDLKP